MSDYAGKKYLEPRRENTPADVALTIVFLIICSAMFFFPIWAK